MPGLPLQSLQQLAQSHLQAGRKAEAVAVLEQILGSYPGFAPAAMLLGALAQETGKPDKAAEYLTRAVAIDPALPEAHFLLGLAHYQRQRLPEAIACYRECVKRQPTHGKAWNNLGRAQLDLQCLQEGKTTLKKAVEIAPQNSAAWNNLGEAYRLLGDIESAMTQYRKATEVDPNCAEAFGNLGVALANQNRNLESIAHLHKALSINPRLFNARFNLALMLQMGGKLDEAIEQCRLAVEIKPEAGEALNLLGNLLGNAGEVAACIQWQQRAVAANPQRPSLFSNLLLSLQYLDDLSPAERLAAHVEWNRRFTRPTPPPPLNCAPDRRLRIGYISPDFQSHSVTYFFEAVYELHDRRRFEIFCYSSTKHPDAVTQRYKKSAEHWRDILESADSRAAEMIRADAVDILIDLAGHTAQNRLPVLGLRPAPIQVTWLGYPDTTGMTAIDYRITDAIADPPGESEAMHTEKLIRLPGCCWAYTAPNDAPEPCEPPFQSNGFVTFGSFNNLPKVTPRVLEVWSEILKAVPQSRLLLKSSGLRGKLGRDYVARHLSQLRIDADRYELLGWQPSTASHLKLYNRIDVALDTFPYNGTTTTCEALWMGVPVITFVGDRHVSRVGASLLTHAGCTDWLANDVGGYIRKAVQLAGDTDAIVTARRELRSRLSASQVCDPLRMARQLENVYEATWTRHCGNVCR